MTVTDCFDRFSLPNKQRGVPSEEEDDDVPATIRHLRPRARVDLAAGPTASSPSSSARCSTRTWRAARPARRSRRTSARSRARSATAPLVQLSRPIDIAVRRRRSYRLPTTAAASAAAVIVTLAGAFAMLGSSGPQHPPLAQGTGNEDIRLASMIKRNQATKVFPVNTIKVVHPVGSPTRPGGGPVVVTLRRRAETQQQASSLFADDPVTPLLILLKHRSRRPCGGDRTGPARPARARRRRRRGARGPRVKCAAQPLASSRDDGDPDPTFRTSRRRMPSEQNGQNVGKVIEIKGVVIDAVFPDRLPEIYNALRISVPGSNGNQPIELVAEVQQLLGDDRVRAVAMDSTDGLARGVDVVDTGGADLRSRRRRHARPAVERARRGDRQRGGARRTSSAGRSTASRRPSATSPRRSRSSRPASRSST